MWRNRLKRVLLTAGIYFPALPQITAPVVYAYRRTFGVPREHGLRALASLNVPMSGVWADVGASIGDGAAMMRSLAPRASIVAFEPNPFFASKLRDRFRTDADVRVEDVALVETAGTFSLYIPVYKRVAFPDLGTLQRADAETWLCDRVYGYRPQDLMVLEHRCKSETLDSFGLAPQLIKIDCRCDAAQVLDGAERTIRKHRPVIVLQASPVDKRASRYLTECEYKPLLWREHKLHEVPLGEPCDILATKSHLKTA